jgi:hypothetical protein
VTSEVHLQKFAASEPLKSFAGNHSKPGLVVTIHMLSTVVERPIHRLNSRGAVRTIERFNSVKIVVFTWQDSFCVVAQNQNFVSVECAITQSKRQDKRASLSTAGSHKGNI